MSYLAVTNFRKYQHYHNRKPPWIKFYVNLLDPNNKINTLPIPTRYLFDRLLLLAAEWDNAIPNDSELIAKLVAMEKRACREGLAQLLEGKWLSERKTNRRASTPASKRASELAPPELEVEEERELEKDQTILPTEVHYAANGATREGRQADEYTAKELEELAQVAAALAKEMPA